MEEKCKGENKKNEFDIAYAVLLNEIINGSKYYTY